MKRHGVVQGPNIRSGKVTLTCRWNGRTEHFLADRIARVPSIVADPVTGIDNNESEVCDAFQDTIRGSVYELYKKRGWEPESD